MTSFWQRWSEDASHALQDMYGNFILGDDAGQSAKIVVVVKPSTHHRRPPTLRNPPSKNSLRSSLGVTFCDINGRAYVQAVDPDSQADLAGVHPKDCLQYAAVLAQEWKDPLQEDLEEIRASALEREAKGQRISFPQLKQLVQTGVYLDTTQPTTPPRNGENPNSFVSYPPSVPTTIQVGTNPCGPKSNGTPSPSRRRNDKDKPLPPPLPTGAEPRPVVLVFRRTTQRPQQSPALPIWPHFRLDDECDVACQILASLATTDDSPDATAPTDATVEATAIRGMIQNAVGLAFLRSNKFVLGVSLHAGSGIVLARLDDGTWSAPSAIGVAGMGLGLQLGIEVAQSILILQTPEALDHFCRGGSFTVGANVGAAVGGVGREAIGAASVSGVLCGQDSSALLDVKDDEYHFAESTSPTSPSSVGVASLVAYAKSQGLYVGVSLEGSRIHCRDDVNARTYQFETQKSVTAHDLLMGKVSPPPEADALYAALQQVEFAHELANLPRPPQILVDKMGTKETWLATRPSMNLPSLEDISSNGTVLADFEDKFRQFLYGGVDVFRVRGRKRERRTLWLYVPEGSGSLQLGFVSKLANKIEAKRTNSEHDDRRSVASEDVTLDSALMDNQSLLNSHTDVRTQVELSRKHSLALTDVSSLSQIAPPEMELEDLGESKRVLSVKTSEQQLLLVALTDQEAHVLLAGLTLLLERECQRCGVRGGFTKDGAPRQGKHVPRKHKRNRFSGYSSSELEDGDDHSTAMSISDMPDGWRSWGRVPGRSYLRGRAAANDHGCPHYVHGQLLVRDIAKNVHLPLPLPLCRVLLLDSSSPVISQWEQDRGDVEFEKTSWTFPPATPREGDQFQSEHQLIASGSMCGAHRTISYERPRSGQLVRLFETQIVDSDDSEKLDFQVHERMPRRGFSIKVKISLRAYNNECEATVLGEIRPVGKNMSNPEAVHKAFMLVLSELRGRYGPEDMGLLARFLTVVNTFKEEDLAPHRNPALKASKAFGEEKKEAEVSSATLSGSSPQSIKLEDMLKANASLGGMADSFEPKSLQDRPTTASPMDMDKYRESYRKPKAAAQPPPSDTFDAPASEPVMIEVKPLPKIRLSLMPSPREEDEENLDEDGEPKSQKSTGSKSKRSRKSWGKKRRSRKSV